MHACPASVMPPAPAVLALPPESHRWLAPWRPLDHIFIRRAGNALSSPSLSCDGLVAESPALSPP